ncbi:MAG: hypothetical protein ACYTAS_17605 [Planctomycetota bacterium]|jgi:hypothetical protein
MRDWRVAGRLATVIIWQITSFVIAGDIPAQAQFEVGQKWVYQHEGPRPGSMEPTAIDGQRIRHVLAVSEEQEHPQWIVQERFTNDEKATSLLFVDRERQLTGFEIVSDQGESIVMMYESPVPYQVPQLAVGEEETFETRLLMGPRQMALPTKSVIRRLADETITTPAGEFVNCQHYHTATQSTLDFKITKIPMTDERDQWYHQSVNGLVKEVYRKGPIKYLAWSCDAYTATSVLASFAVEEVAPSARLAVLGDPNDPNSTRRADTPMAVTPRGSPRWVPVAAISAVLAVAVLVFVRRPLRKQPPAKSVP